MIKGIIFDMDGTLLDSLDAWVDIGNTYLRSINIAGDPQLDERMKDMSLQQGASYIKENFHLKQSVDEIIQGVHQIIEKKYKEDIPLFPGVQSFLEKCYQKGLIMCVLTASSSRLAKIALERLHVLHYFQDVYSCQTIGYPKSDTRCYLETIKLLGIDTSECIVIEDALYAIQSATQAGLRVKAIQNKENQKHWGKICQLTQETYQSFEEMEV